MITSQRANSFTSRYPKCPSCQESDGVHRNGPDYLKDGTKIQGYYCRRCKFSFLEKYAKERRKIDADKLARDFLIGKFTLKQLSRTYGMKKSTLHSIIHERVNSLPSTFDNAKKHHWGEDCNVLAIDTLSAKTGNAKTIVLYTVNALTGKPLNCDIIEHEDAQTMTGVLLKMRNELGCDPVLIICDRAAALLKSVKAAFPDATIQACVFHAMKSLNEDLPTDGRIVGADREIVVRRRHVKWLITTYLYSTDIGGRRRIVRELTQIDLKHDPEARSVVERFLDAIDYYHPLGILQRYLGITTTELRRVIYNNLCEGHFNLLEQQGKKQMGWKTRKSVGLYVNAFWYYWLQEGHATKEHSYVFTLPRTLVHEEMTASEIDRLVTYGISRELVEDSLGKVKALNVGKIVVTLEMIEDMRAFVRAAPNGRVKINDFIANFNLTQYERCDVKDLVALLLQFNIVSTSEGTIEICVPL